MIQRRIHNPFIVLFFVFLGVGLLFVFLSVCFAIYSISFIENGTEVMAKIVGYSNGQNEYTDVSFYVNGIPYLTRIDYCQSGLVVGDYIKIIYNNANPYEAINLVSQNILICTFGVLGLGFFIAAIIMQIINHKNRHLKDLVNTGKRVLVKITSIRENHSLKVNRVSPYIIHCIDNNQVNYRSKNIFADLSDLRVNDMIYVYVDNDNPKKYYVDYEKKVDNSVMDYFTFDEF